MAQKQVGTAKRLDAWMAFPEEVCVIGRDTKDGPEHPRWDRRLEMPFDQELFESIRDLGMVIEPIIVGLGKDENGEDRWEVDVGRNRIFCAREVNKERVAKGLDPIRVPLMVRRTAENDIGLIIAAENHVRRDDGIVATARLALRLREQGHSVERIGKALKKDKNTVGKLCALALMPQPILDAVDAGTLAVGAAVALKDLSRAKQLEALQAHSALAPAASETTSPPASAAPAAEVPEGSQSAPVPSEAVSGSAPDPTPVATTTEAPVSAKAPRLTAAKARAVAAKAKGQEVFERPSVGVINQLIEAQALGCISLDAATVKVLKWVASGKGEDRIGGLVAALRVLKDPRVLRDARKNAKG